MIRLLVGIVGLSFAVEGAPAGVLVDTGGFESFNNAVLEGQQGWWSAGTAASTATVMAANGVGGGKGVRINAASNSDRFWAKPIGSEQISRYVTVDWDMRVQWTGATNGFGPFFGVAVFDDSINRVGEVARFGLDATTGETLYRTAGPFGSIFPGPLGMVPGAAGSFSNWAHFRLLIDFGSKTYQGFVNGQLLVTSGLVDSDVKRVTDADLAASPAAGDSGSIGMTGSADIDNFIVRDFNGDYNHDGVVNAADYTLWRDSNGATGAGLAADGDGNGSVGPSDYNVWKATYGAQPPASAFAIPEPAALAAVALGFIAAACRRR